MPFLPRYNDYRMELFTTTERSEWRAFLSDRYNAGGEVWFVFPVLGSGEKSLSYNDAVEEALCFGWIDSVNRRLDGSHCIRRFSPRKKASPYSRPNTERLIWLDERGMLLPSVREEVLPVLSAPFRFPPDIMEALKQDSTVWENYLRFTEPYKRIRIAYIDAARNRPEEFTKRLNSFIEKTRQNKLIKGYGGIDKYYGGQSK